MTNLSTKHWGPNPFHFSKVLWIVILKKREMQKDNGRPITGHICSFLSASPWTVSEPRGSTATPERMGLQRKGEEGKEGCRPGGNLS